jgi:hypothetical protein
MSMKKCIVTVSALLLCMTSLTFAQGTTNLGENVNYWKKGNTPLFVAESLYLGGPFLRDTAKPFVVTYIGTQAAWLGVLYLMLPSDTGSVITPDGKRYTRYFIMTNHETKGYQVDLTNVAKGKIQHLDTVVFCYQTYWGAGHWTNPHALNWADTIPAPYNLGPRYSGPNRSPLDNPPWQHNDRFWSTDVSTRFPNNVANGAVGNDYLQGRRWCVAGWINDPLTGEKTDTVEFGFEDENDVNPGAPLGWNGTGDKNFNDILYHVTGLFLIHPKLILTLDARPPVSTMPAGDTLSIFAKITDEQGIERPEFEDEVTWRLVDSSGQATRSWLKTTGGSSDVFHAIDAYRTVYIIGRFDKNPLDPARILLDTIVVHVIPGPPDSLFIEASPDSLISLNASRRLGSVTFGQGTQKDSVYAILRDHYGNFVSHASLASWATENPAIATAQPTTHTNLGEGEILRQTPDNTSTKIWAYQVIKPGDTLADFVQVILNNIPFTQIQIVVRGNVPIDSLKMKTDQDTTISAIGLRNGKWEDVQVTWGNHPTMNFNNAAPTSATFWRFRPSHPDTGIIFIALNDLRDTIMAIFNYGDPDHMTFYPKIGAPGPQNVAYPPAITVAAGDTTSLYAKLFSKANEWLSGYERPNAPFAWTIQEMTGGQGSGSLLENAGYLARFVGIKAPQTVRVTATFTEGTITITQTITIQIVHGPAAKLVIEADTAAKANDILGTRRAGQVTIGSTSTSMPVYAVLRDKFGNFVDFSDPTNWLSRDAAKVGADRGNVALGEGITSRQLNVSVAQVIVLATDSLKPAFHDSVLVVLSNINYDSLRIVSTPTSTVRIDSLTLPIDKDSVIYVQGYRSDNHLWELVPANWTITNNLKTKNPAPTGMTNWTVNPNDTGSGQIIVSLGGKTVPDTIKVHFIAGPPDHIVLYPKDGLPNGQNQQYPNPTEALIDSAGRPLPVVAKVFDRLNNWLPAYEVSSAPIGWTLVEFPANQKTPTGTFDKSNGYKTNFLPTVAYNNVYIIATFDQAGKKFVDSIQVRVVPGPPNHLVLEPDSKLETSPNKDNPADSVVIPSTEAYRFVYAVLRDQFGNYIGPSLNTAWQTALTDVVTAADGQKSIGQGVITKNLNPTTNFRDTVTAASLDYPGLQGKVLAVVLNYYYTELQIYVIDKGGQVDINSLSMYTDADTTLKVKGKRSDPPNNWEDVQAKWENSTSLNGKIIPIAPEKAFTWTFSPTLPATGWIRVTLGNDAQTIPDTVQVTFLRSPPRKVDIEIITPPPNRKAGDTITAVVRVRNLDGLVPGQWCDTAVYGHLLPNGTGRPTPIVKSDTVVTLGSNMYECFNDGVDTVKFVLFYAPFNDSQEQLNVTLPRIQPAFSDKFKLYPGDLAVLKLEDISGKNLDSLTLTPPNGAQQFIAMGYDSWGNKRGRESSNWVATPNLHAIDKPTNQSSIYYTTGSVSQDETGYIKAAAPGIGGKLVSDSCFVTIPIGLLIKNAYTRDGNGNGYLDSVRVVFLKNAILPAGSKIILANGKDSTTLVVDSIISVSNHTGSKVDPLTRQTLTALDPDTAYILVLKEPTRPSLTSSTPAPQTGWTPDVIITPPYTSIAKPMIKTCADSAGPVIWLVQKTIKDAKDRTKDEVTVVFSEPIGTKGGGTYKNNPALTFIVWEKNGPANGDSVFFHDISSDTSKDASSITFKMTNGNDLTALDSLKLVEDGQMITDKNGNAAVKLNQKEPCVVIGPKVAEMLVSPNPTTPTFTRKGPGILEIANNSQARSWVYADHQSGTVFTFPYSPSPGQPGKKIVELHLKIYDVIGNLVQVADTVNNENGTDGVMPQGWGTGASRRDYDMYWNGSNSKGMPVAAGVYKALLYIKYADGTVEKLPQKVGIR